MDEYVVHDDLTVSVKRLGVLVADRLIATAEMENGKAVSLRVNLPPCEAAPETNHPDWRPHLPQEAVDKWNEAYEKYLAEKRKRPKRETKTDEFPAKRRAYLQARRKPDKQPKGEPE